MYKLLLIILFCSISVLAMGQKAIDPSKQIDTTGKKDIINVIRSVFHINPQPDTTKKGKAFYFSILPLSSSIPGGGKALFTSTTAGFYLGDRSTTYISSVTFSPYFNLHGRFGFPFRSNIWLKDNTCIIQ